MINKRKANLSRSGGLKLLQGRVFRRVGNELLTFSCPFCKSNYVIEELEVIEGSEVD